MDIKRHWNKKDLENGFMTPQRKQPISSLLWSEVTIRHINNQEHVKWLVIYYYH